MKMNLAVASAALLTLAACGSEKPVAAVAMPDSYAAEVAATVLESGGNAVDASIAAAFSLVSSKSGLAAWARSTKSCTAAYWAICSTVCCLRSALGIDSGGTG